MAIPKPDPRDWQIANAQELQLTDRQVLAMLRAAKKNVDKILAELPAGKQEIKRAQLESTRARLLAEQASIFERLGDIVSARRARAASRSSGLSAAADRALLDAIGKGAEGQFLYKSALEIGQRQIDAAMARMRLSQLPLSKRIYNTSVWMQGRLGKLINETLASGLNAKEFAKRARDWFNPNTPGGVRYAAMRLARTEINNAFHAMTAEKAANDPWVHEVDWNLSKSHPKPDICNVVHAESPFPADKVPARPHPQCMCYITPKAIEEDEFIDNFLKGDYDEFLDKELAAAGWGPEEKKKSSVAPMLPKTQAAALEKFTNGFTRDEWNQNGANLNAIDVLIRKKVVVPTGETKTAFAQGKPYQSRTFRLAEEPTASQNAGTHAQTPEQRAPITAPDLNPKPSNDGYAPGNWQLQTDNEKRIVEIQNSLKKAAPDMSDQQTREMAEKFLAGTANDNDVNYLNGPHEVLFTGNISEEKQKLFLSYVDQMQTKFPAGRNLAIRVASSTEFGWDTGGETTLGTGYIRINEKVMLQDFWPGMPVSKDVPSALYVLAHKWGHAFPDKEQARDKHAHHHAVQQGGMSRYGTQGGDGAEGNAAEGYAEAFAEWSLSDGKTTNKAAQDYAKRFKWGERFGNRIH